MGVDTKGIAQLERKDQVHPYEVVEKIESSIMSYMKKHAKELVDSGKADESQFSRESLFHSPQFRISRTPLMNAEFRFAGEDRCLFIHTTIGSDGRDICDAEHRVLMSLGRWGHSEELMAAALDGFEGHRRFLVPEDTTDKHLIAEPDQSMMEVLEQYRQGLVELHDPDDEYGPAPGTM